MAAKKTAKKKVEVASATLPGGTKVTGPKSVIEKVKDRPAVRTKKS